MDFNKFIFPAPNSSYTPFDLDQLLWIPRTRFFSMKSLVKSMDKFEHFSSKAKSLNRTNSDDTNNKTQSKTEQSYIPCHYQKFEEGSKNLILYFHGNAEDIGYASGFARKLAYGLKVKFLY